MRTGTGCGDRWHRSRCSACSWWWSRVSRQEALGPVMKGLPGGEAPSRVTRSSFPESPARSRAASFRRKQPLSPRKSQPPSPTLTYRYPSWPKPRSPALWTPSGEGMLSISTVSLAGIDHIRVGEDEARDAVHRRRRSVAVADTELLERVVEVDEVVLGEQRVDRRPEHPALAVEARLLPDVQRDLRGRARAHDIEGPVLGGGHHPPVRCERERGRAGHGRDELVVEPRRHRSPRRARPTPRRRPSGQPRMQPSCGLHAGVRGGHPSPGSCL